MFQDLIQTYRGYSIGEVLIELVIMWLCVWAVVRFLRGTRGAGVIKGLALVIVLLILGLRVMGAESNSFERLKFISSGVFGILATLLIVVFQPELRQAMIRLGQARFFGRGDPTAHQVARAMSEAVEFLSRNQFGALVVIERGVRLGGMVENGVQLDAKVTSRLLQTIFWPNSPLHDLAVVLRGDRILAANVQLPLAEEGLVPVRLGSRHRAAVGMSLESDALVVIVSEETGEIRIAEHGRLSPAIPREEFEKRLLRRLDAPEEGPAAEPEQDETLAEELADESDEDSAAEATDDAAPERAATAMREGRNTA